MLKIDSPTPRLLRALHESASTLQTERSRLLEEYAGQPLSCVKASQVHGGLRGVLSIICETSIVDPLTGLVVRGHPLADLATANPEDVLWLLLTGALPQADDQAELARELSASASLPGYVPRLLQSLPPNSHPMVMLCAAILSMQRESVFSNAYNRVPNSELWVAALEDALNLLARLPSIASAIYQICYRGGMPVEEGKDVSRLDWAARLTHGLGTVPGPRQADFRDTLRLLAVVQCDHEGANACALTANTVASSLASPYLALASGLSALAGPVHGLASEMSLRFMRRLIAEHGGVPSDDQILAQCSATLDAGSVIPGFGHAVLRNHDPRFVLLFDLAAKIMPEDELFKVCSAMARLVPPLLVARGKAKNPWPNVDFVSGVVLSHFGIAQPEFFTVVFGISIAFGVLSQYVLNRALQSPILRPRSINLAGLKQLALGAE